MHDFSIIEKTRKTSKMSKRQTGEKKKLKNKCNN